jgi:TusA-related sulfurtransferase
MGISEKHLMGIPEEEIDSELRSALEALSKDGVLVLRLARTPEAWTRLLEKTELRIQPGTRGGGECTLAIQKLGAPEIIDLRDLEAPEPLERILLEAAALIPGEVLLVRTPRMPRMLFPQLDKRNLEWEALEECDESGLIWVRRPI